MEYLKFTPNLANDWKNALSTSESYVFKRVMDSMNESQLESKLWLIQELVKLNIKPKRVAILAGWFAQYIVSLLYDNFESIECIKNFEIDQDVKDISYKYNKRYKDSNKYQFSIKDVMMQTMEEDFDLIINCACEHMYPMTKFYELNPHIKGLYVLHSTDDDQYDDHINCVGSPEELAEQANIINVLYSGQKLLSNGMNRFMVIGYP
ncbi:methyltransferase type 11 [uncultured Mediterranean phage]|nr:methyltransferase type 11 [uncultured Mediterranean phage]